MPVTHERFERNKGRSIHQLHLSYEGNTATLFGSRANHPTIRLFRLLWRLLLQSHRTAAGRLMTMLIGGKVALGGGNLRLAPLGLPQLGIGVGPGPGRGTVAVEQKFFPSSQKNLWLAIGVVFRGTKFCSARNFYFYALFRAEQNFVPSEKTFFRTENSSRSFFRPENEKKQPS